MDKFVVCVREVYIQGYAVDAMDEGEAISKVVDGEGDPVGLLPQYSHTLDPETWTVERV
jgi:hypothetical protein